MPPDYADLTLEGQRLARVNAASLRTSPEDAAYSWAWFRRYYLLPDPESGFDPGFYRPPIHESPPGHYQLVKWLYSGPFIAIQAPRGWAKSTIRKSVSLWSLTGEPKSIWNTILVKDDHVLRDTAEIRAQFEVNSRLIEDFGELRPVRGSGMWTGHSLMLTNGSVYQGAPINGALRGLRGTVCLDDIERSDEDRPASLTEQLALRERITRVIIPMLDSHNRLLLMGTFTGMNSFLYSIITTEDDERFRSIQSGGDWLKINLVAVDDAGNNAWPAKYTEEFLERKKRAMGFAAFSTEYLGKPMSTDAAPFKLGPEHEYTIQPDRHTPDFPFSSPAPLVWQTRGPDDSLQSHERPYGETVRQMTRVMIVDPATSLKAHADYSAIVVAGLDSQNVLWVLDAWQGRVTHTSLAAIVWRLAQRWRVGLIAVEAFAAYIEVYRLVKEFGLTSGQSDWRPSVLEFRPPATYSKEDRIMSLQWRFTDGRIRLPASLPDSQSAIRELRHQIVNFTPDGKGLTHDDLIDALSGTHFVMRNSGQTGTVGPDAPQTVEERLQAGELYYPGTDIPLITGVDWRGLTPDCLDAILEAGRARLADPTQRTYLDAEPPLVSVHLGD